jgi:hypothetical protein
MVGKVLNRKPLRSVTIDRYDFQIMTFEDLKNAPVIEDIAISAISSF